MDKSAFEERFWSKVEERGPDECWPWLGSMDHGTRPVFALSRKVRTTAARALWYLLYDEMPDPKRHWVRHTCGNVACVNPEHLFLEARTSPNPGHGERASGAKLTEAQARGILAARGTVTAKALAAQYGISQPLVWAIWRGHRWKHLHEES